MYYLRENLSEEDLQLVRQLADLDLIEYWQKNITLDPHCKPHITTVPELHWHTVQWSCNTHRITQTISVRDTDGLVFSDLNPAVAQMVYAGTIPYMCSAHHACATYISQVWDTIDNNTSGSGRTDRRYGTLTGYREWDSADTTSSM